MISGMALVAEVNSYLDNLKTPKNEEEIKSNIEILKKYKEEMERLGFKTPYKGMLTIPKQIFHENSEMELREISKQIKILKYIAYLKKITLNRTNVSLVAHNIGLSTIKNRREDLYNSLPFDGNYVGLLATSGIEGNYAFRKLNDLLTSNMNEKGKSWVVATVEYFDNGEKKRTSVKLTDVNEEIIKNLYGEDAKIIKTKVVRQKQLISSTISQLVVTIMFSVWATRKTKEMHNMLNDENKIKKEIEEYNKILSYHGLVHDIIVENIDGYDDLKNELIEKGIMERINGTYRIKSPLREIIYSRRRKINEITARYAVSEFLRYTYSYFIKNSRLQRTNNNLYPGLSLKPDDEALTIFDELINTHKIMNASKILREKLRMEESVPRGFNRFWGVGLFAKLSGKDKKWCAEFFDLSEKEVEDAITSINSISGKRGEEFIKLLKKEKGNGNVDSEG